MCGVQQTRVTGKRDEQRADSADPVELFSTTSDETRRSCRTASMLAEGRQSRKTFQKNHREGSDSSCGELSVRLGEALEAEVWKCQLSTCQKQVKALQSKRSMQ